MMFGSPLCDELRGYLDVKVPSAARKKGLLINWKAWRRRWLVVRRFLVSSDPTLVNGEEVTILGRRLEVKLTGDDSGNVSAPCPIVVVEEWQEDALICPTKSRSHPYAFGLFPQPGCEPVLFLSGRSAEESRRWLASIRSLLVPPFRPHSFRLSSISHSPVDDSDMPFHHSSPLSSSPEIYQSRSAPSKSQHTCFPPLPPLPSRCRIRRRSSLESLSAPSYLMDRRRSLSDSEITSSATSDHHHHRHSKCQTVINALDSERSKNERLSEDYDHHHIYAGIGDSGVCSSMSNDSRSCLSSSSSSCSSSSGLYAYASASVNGFTSYLKEDVTEASAETNVQMPSQSKVEESSLLGGKVASSLVSAGIGLVFSTPVPLDGVPELRGLPVQSKEFEDAEEKLRSLVCVPCKQEEMDMDRRESIASGIYEEIQDDDQSLDVSGDVFSTHNEQAHSGHKQSPPPLPPRSPSQCFLLSNGKQKDLAWFLGVHRHSNSCPASDVEDDEPSRESSPINGQDDVALLRPRRKISEPSGSQPNHDENRTTTVGYSRRKRKNLESFLGIMEFGSRAKEMSKSGVSFLNKSLGALEISGGAKSEKSCADKAQEWQSRGRTYTDSAGTKLSNVFTDIRESSRCSSTGALLTTVGSKLKDMSQEDSNSIDKIGDFELINDDAGIQSEEEFKKTELQESEVNKESPSPLSKSPENLEIRVGMPLEDGNIRGRCHSFTFSSPNSCQSNKTDVSDKGGQSPKSPRSITKRFQWMKPNLMKLLLKEQNRQQDPPSLRDKTKQVINRSLETLGWLSLATGQFEEVNTNLTVGGSSFYRSATCTGADMQNERQNALRRGASGFCKDEITMLDRRRPSKKISKLPLTSEMMSKELENTDSGIYMPLKLLEDSAICPYHKSQLKKLGDTLEDIERLAKQELICEQFCMSKTTNDPVYIPMRPLKNKEDEEQVPCSRTELDFRPQKRVSVVHEEDHYMSMEGIRTALHDEDQKVYKDDEPLDPVKLENSTNQLLYRSDSDLYMSMEGSKSSQKELAQR